MTPDSASLRLGELEAENLELKRKLKEFETLLEFLPVGVGIASDPECRDIRINQTLAHFLGTEPGANVSQTGPRAAETSFKVMQQGRVLAGYDQPIQVAAREGRTLREVEVDVVRADGSVVNQLCFAQPLYDDNHVVKGSIGVILDITERRRTEQALRASEAGYRFLAEALPQIVWVSHASQKLLYINQYWTTYTGLTLEETQRLGWQQAVHPDDLGFLKTQAATGLETGSFQAEYRIRRHSDGVYRWHLGRSRIVTNETGEPRWLGTAVDIHDRKRAEQERVDALKREHDLRFQAESALDLQRRVEQQLLLLVDASSTLMAHPDSDRMLTRILDLARQFVGADAYAVWRRVNHSPEWRVLAEEGLSDAYSRTAVQQSSEQDDTPLEPFAIEDVEHEEYVAHRLDAYRAEGIRSMMSVPMPIRGVVEGTIVFYYRQKHRFNELELRVASGLGNLAAAALGTAEMYDEQTALRVKAEAAERRANFLAEAGRVLSSSLDYETTLSSVADLAVPVIADWATVEIVDETGVRRRVVQRHLIPEKIELARQYSERYPADDSSLISQAVKTGTTAHVREISEQMLIDSVKDPVQLDLLLKLGLKSVIVAPLVSGGKAYGALTFVSAESGRLFDDSDVALAEELAGRAATAVANAHLYREQQSSREALQKSNVELRRANEDVNQFAYSASHDLREPLRMIGIYSQLLEQNHRNQLDDEARQFLSWITAGAQRMDMLIHDILEYTQAASITAGSIAPLPANQALTAALENLAASISETGATISADALPVLKVQEIHLIQLFQNLIGNAIKYRSSAAPDIHIQAEPLGSMWKISISDNGIGIESQYATQIFGIFTRLHSGEKYTGTGIGLAICLKIVERYGGEIKVESGAGRGSTFWFTLPGAGQETAQAS